MRSVGTVSRDLLPPAEGQLFQLPFAALVRLEVELSGPAHAYLIAFHPNGTEQLLWPVNADKKADPTVVPPRADRLKYPARRGANGEPVLFRLDDEPRGGLQAFAVVLARAPLPSFAEWREARGPAPWRREEGWKGLWLADAEGVYPVLPGRGAVRGTEVELSVPPLRRLCQALRRGAAVDGVEVLAVPVGAKEGQR
jgi:hypothetical protein